MKVETIEMTKEQQERLFKLRDSRGSGASGSQY